MGVLENSAPVIHIVGASEVEQEIEWASLCDLGAAVVLVGPTVVPHRSTKPKLNESHSYSDSKRKGENCVSAIKGLYSHAAVRRARIQGQLARHEVKPDVFILHNADLYMCTWRRTLAELLQNGAPVILTMYCEFEGASMQRLFKWPEREFSAEALNSCDSMVQRAFGSSTSVSM